MDIKFMKEALAEAEKGHGKTGLNPLVGAVIVKDGEIISRGFHKQYGDVHAEVDAINNAKNIPIGSEMYVNLEPCCHEGKQPPCTTAIMNTPISKVYIGSTDPNIKVSGKGIKTLKQAGIEVVTDVLKEECDKLNEAFFYHINHKMPFVTLKSAVSLDGKTATQTGKSKWISCTKSREYSHFLRHINQSIAVGISTVLSDNPNLNSRIENAVDPVKIIFDSTLKTPHTANLLTTGEKTLIFTTSKYNRENYSRLYKIENTEIIITDEDENGKINLRQALKEIYERKIASVLVEGGGEINFSLLKEKLVQKIILFYAPIIIGGQKAPSFSGKIGFDELNECPQIENISYEQCGKDLKLEGYISSQE
ncbi:MAG: bifunctional diaminohydroxyphosphoribosylaminopyrimidine deaminase/5-amino-6-(5-phosphoribosylamino)uracil reductase RibD [Clostridia bacterium]|nr:bifunctional diaminohydroxyphosphoribosylaminopyrimidine deaminase/5-amino-6-(5-phosphoribosylamino)uracil reductase RibD [Clostridia bacterium]